MPWDFSNPFIIALQVETQHLDALNHTNNVVYLEWMEKVAWEHSAALGLTFNDYQRTGYAMVAARHEIDYLGASYANEQLLLGTWIIASNRLSTERAYQLIRSNDQKTLMRARTRWVCIDLVSGQARRMPAEFIKAYQVST